MNSLQIRWRHLLALSLILLCSVSALFARPLSEREARHLAEQFFHQVAYAHKVLAPAQQPLSLVSAPIRQSAGVELRTLSGDKARYYYIYNRGSNAGFVIIAGDDELTPYIGYATTGQVLEQDMPEQLRAFLKACQERIDELTSSVGLRSSLRPTPRTATEPAQIAPLLGNIQWNQSAPWNNQTPTDNQGKHMPVGCVATAYTQVMRYHQWPTQGEGTFSYTEERSNRQHSVDYGATTYDWAHMPERYNDPSSATSEETQALSTLAYHAGVAVEMMYAPSGSGSYTPLVARALADHFRYDKRVSFKSRSNYTQSSWEQMLRAELIAARPVVYSGSGSGGGHAFVCDGYDMEGLFHINWGWGGMSDGYFNLNYLVPSDLGIGGGAGGGFSLGQGAVVGIKPDKTGSSQRQESSLVTTWRFGMTFTEGTLDASAEYTVTLTTDATPYDGSVTYGVTKVGTTDTLYLDQYARNARIDGLYQDFSIDPEELQLSNHIGVGTWDFFLAYRHTDAKGQTAWRPCGQHERAKEQYRHTYTITQESDGSYVVTEEASSNLSMLELVAGSVQSSIVGYEKSKVSLQLRNTGRVEFFGQLYLYARKVGERIFEPVVNILPAIDAGAVKEVTFEIDRFPYGSGDVELEVGYFIGDRFNQLSTTTVSIQSATDIRTAYVLSSDQPVTVNVNSGNLSQIRIRNIGTKTPTNRVFYRWELQKEKQTASTRWTQIDIPAGGEQLVAPNLADELSQIGAKRGDNITLTATFVEASDEERIISVIPLMEEAKLSVYCDGELVVGDGVITMTTARAVGENISFSYLAEGDVVIEGATGTPKEKEWVDYTLTSQQVSLRGDITQLFCIANELTNLDVSQCSSLKGLACFLNQIKGDAMTQLVNSLPDRTGKEAGVFAVYALSQEERNRCLKSDVAIAKAKNWQVALATIENGKLKYYLYEGEDDSQPSVGDGVITMTTSRAVGEQIRLSMRPVEGQTVIAEGLKEPLTLDGTGHFYTLTSQTVTLRGNLTSLNCNGLYSRGEGSPISHQNQLTSLDVSSCKTLRELDCSENLLQSLDVSGCKTLSELNCSRNSLQSLDITHNEALTRLYCFNNQLETLDLSHARALTSLLVSENRLTDLDLSQCLNLRFLDLPNNQLTSLDVSHNPNLEGLYCDGNPIERERMTQLVKTLSDRTGQEEGTFVPGKCLKSDVAIAKAKNWKVKDIYDNPYEGEDDSQPSVGDGVITMTTSRAVGEQIMLAVSPVEGQTVIAEGLKESLILDGTGHLYTLTNQTVTLRGNLTLLQCDGAVDMDTPPSHENQLTSLDINCETLTLLSCDGNQLTSLDLSHARALTTLVCYENKLTQLDLSSCTKLTGLGVGENQLTHLDVSHNGELQILDCSDNQLTALDVSKNTALTSLYCRRNQLTALDVSKNTALTSLYCHQNQLTALDVSKNTALTSLYCPYNQLTALDVSKNTELEALYCYDNQIKGEEMTRLVNSLPERTGKKAGIFTVVQGPKLEGNICLKSDVAIAKGKNWNTLKFESDIQNFVPYEGAEDAQPLKVTLTKEGEGALTATGADDLNAVPYGTELSIEATPAEGYQLTALTANGTDILASKKVVVTSDLTIKATFTKKAFAVSLTKEGEGTITATGASNLNSVAYGTELTINATPAEGYELTALTANGTDILATKKIVVTDNVTVKATFAKKTFAVKLTKEGEGTLVATGADDLNAVPYGTELTIATTPSEGYELTALTANGTDILATKKFVVKDNVTVKATFAKKTFAVKLTKEGEGTLVATGADDLNAVPYGTELTVIATPAEGYELTALTANGTDILATKKFVVKGATEVKATFTKKNFAVTFAKEGKGKLTATGANNLNAVPYGTKLTVEAAPAEGYELTALTANGKDILSSKKFTVKETVEVKATFTKKTFTVTFTQEGEGKLTATGADNLNSVAYGTELTIVATPAEGYELTALTANGEDILATKKFVVKGATDVKATFTKKTFAVTFAKEGEGTITATGADDLNAVAYGTELTIVATPAEGYELTALTANGEDILATKKFVVKGATEVKAIFEKKTFAVTLTSNEHGTISIVENVDLKAVPYGTTLTVQATGKNDQCELTALTANGEDILATKKFVVKGATEVKATFVDHTGVETTVTQQVKLYPNPATDYVIVEGIAPASEVMLHSMTGELMCAMQADAEGHLQIDLTALSDGVYLLVGTGWQERLVVKK